MGKQLDNPANTATNSFPSDFDRNAIVREIFQEIIDFETRLSQILNRSKNFVDLRLIVEWIEIIVGKAIKISNPRKETSRNAETREKSET